jgi:sortase A
MSDVVSRGARGWISGFAIGALALLAACGGSSQASEPPPTLITAPTTTTTTLAPATTTTTTTTTLAPTTTTTSTTTVATTTTTTTPAPTTIAPVAVETIPAAEPGPIAPPADNASEPLSPIGRIEIPAIGVDRTMYEGITLKTLNNGPGHWPGTAVPGQVGNAVVAGHRTSHNRDFRNIDQLSPGDEIILSTDSGRYVYRVTRTEIVKPDAVWIVDQTPTATATLFACHPPGSTRERIVVFADLVV